MTQKQDPDLFEEFEFRPLSAGLGFHKKSELAEARLSTSPSSSSTRESRENIAGLKMPLPREPQPSRERSAPKGESSPVLDNLKGVFEEKAKKRIQQNRIWDIDDGMLSSDSTGPIQNLATKASTDLSSQTETEAERWKATSFDLTALLLDSMVIGALFMVCMTILWFTTGIDVITGLSRSSIEPDLIVASLGLLVAISWIYMVATRMFAGCTAGEFVFDHRLGLPSQAKGALYSWKVALRTTLLFVTGLVTIPLIEEIVGKDLLGALLGLKHYRKIPLGRSNRP